MRKKFQCMYVDGKEGFFAFSYADELKPLYQHKDVENSHKEHNEIRINEKLIYETAHHILGRKVYTPIEFRRVFHCTKHDTLERLWDVISQYWAIKATNGNPAFNLEKIILKELCNIILFHWPHNHSDELRLSPAERPEVEFRRALDYISYRNGIIENTEEVARAALVGIRTLEAYFAKWLGMGIARYCKLYRIQVAHCYREETGMSYSELARLFSFSNASRLKHDIEDLNNIDVELAPAALYRKLRSAQAPSIQSSSC